VIRDALLSREDNLTNVVCSRHFRASRCQTIHCQYQGVRGTRLSGAGLKHARLVFRQVVHRTFFSNIVARTKRRHS
jgi:hypothetical protein